MSFKGYDYTELFPFLGLGEFDDADVEIEAFRAELKKLIFNHDPVVIPLIREYVVAMVEADPGYWGPIWRGLSDCEDDFTFMQACYALAEHMWT